MRRPIAAQLNADSLPFSISSRSISDKCEY
jgi:hypothetical protein